MPLQHGNAQGVAALICPGDVKPKNSRDDGSLDPPGFPSPNQNRDSVGTPIFNRTHILADRFYGEWRPENIFKGYRLMNVSGMKKCENRMALYITKNQQPVLHFGRLQYTSGGVGTSGEMPGAIQMTATTPNGVLFNTPVNNANVKQVTC
ncbi:DNA/RNA non-specific endonuclease [Streptomyces sp. MUSC 125]|uniref:DNA/RNA non-specific endonuclease n=1 Tax=Streptomyces sp. MUSC 125 TaxID=1428624 RepID=UPI00131CFAC2